MDISSELLSSEARPSFIRAFEDAPASGARIASACACLCARLFFFFFQFFFSYYYFYVFLFRSLLEGGIEEPQEEKRRLSAGELVVRPQEVYHPLGESAREPRSSRRRRCCWLLRSAFFLNTLHILR